MKINKLKLADIENLEAYLASWMYTRRYRFVLFAFVIFILMSSFFVPYLNLVVTSYFLILVGFVLAPFLLDMEPELFFISGIFLFFLVFIIWFLGQTEEAENLTNYVYIILLSGSLRALFH